MAAKRKQTEPVPFDVIGTRRVICAHYVRAHPIPAELRIHDYLHLPKIAMRIRAEMKDAGADDSEVETYVERYVKGG